MNKKIVIASLFATLMLMIPITTVVSINSDVNYESRENYEIKPSNDYQEIITFIDGTCYDVITKGIYIKRDVTFQGGWLDISGYYRPWNHFNEIDVVYIHAPIYIGIIFSHAPKADSYSIWGFALGDIEWHK